MGRERKENMFKLILCALAVSFVSAAPISDISADNVGVNKPTVLPTSFVISGTHNASISGTYNQIAYVCNSLPVYQKGGSDGLVLYMQGDYTFWHVGGPAQATNASGPPGTTNCGYMDPIYLTSGDGFCKIRPDVCGNWWSEFPSGYGHPDPADCVKDPQQCHNEAVKIVAAAPVSATQQCDAAHRECTEDRECRKDPGCDDWQCFMGTDHRGTCAQDAVVALGTTNIPKTMKAVGAQCGGFCKSNAECWKKGPGCGSWQCSYLKSTCLEG